jgi:hypothetical protein
MNNIGVQSELQSNFKQCLLSCSQLRVTLPKRLHTNTTFIIIPFILTYKLLYWFDLFKKTLRLLSSGWSVGYIVADPRRHGNSWFQITRESWLYFVSRFWESCGSDPVFWDVKEVHFIKFSTRLQYKIVLLNRVSQSVSTDWRVLH